MPSQADYSKALWLAFGQVIKDQVAPNLDTKKTAIFFATKAQLGPPANDSSKIAPAYTNLGIFNIGNNLLSADNLTYVPSQANSYIRGLLAYLDEVDLMQNVSDTNRAYHTQCLEDLRSAEKRFDDEKKIAFASWKADIEMGFAAGSSFPVWVAQNSPSYSAAANARAAAASSYDNALRQIAGPHGEQYSQDKTKISNAINQQQLIPGITMEVTGDTPLSAAEIDRYVTEKKAIPAPDIYYAAKYSAPDYASAIKSWISSSTSSSTGGGSQTISFDKGKTVDETSFGQTSVSVGLSIPTPWFSFSASGSNDHEESSVFGSEDQQQISITVSWADMRSVSIYPGDWDIKDFTQYPLKDGAKTRLKSLVRPTQMVIINKLGYEIKFDGSTKDTMTTRMKDVISGKIGALRVFGIDAAASRTDEKTSHTASWDEQKGVLKLEPSSTGFQANICAIVGDKINIA